TLVIWGGEFGRTNYCQGNFDPKNYGRDHHPRAFSIWMAGGGIKPGITYGETDEFGYNIINNPVHINDFHATIMHNMGLDHEQLIYKYQGRRFRLTDVAGDVVKDILISVMVKGDSPKCVGHAIFGLTVFLVFLLIFESFIDLPDLVTWLGRFHPVVLHFPIVLLLIAAVIGLSGNKVPGLLLGVATFSVLVTAITGFFLGTGPEPKGNLVFWHQWMGVGVAILAVVWYWIEINPLKQIYLVRTIQVMLIILVGLTGHYGGMLTHGEDFLDLPNSKKMGKIPDNPLIYEDIVHRVLDVNCIGCHNPNKKKGELLMTGIQELLVGGENGAAIVRGQPDNSELIKRLRLPPENEEHMPPEGKKPLSENEILILERWIALGASDTLRLN